MSTQGTSSSPQKSPNSPNGQVKTVFNLLSRLKHAPETESKTNGANNLETEENDDIVILRKDPVTKHATINKSAYSRLHRNLSPNRESVVEKIREKYELNADDTNNHSEAKPEVETLESIKNKYSPSGLGYSQSPVAKPRRSRLTKSQIIVPTKKEQLKSARLSLNIEKNKTKDVNSNNLQHADDDLSSEEEITIITRSDSEESVLRYQRELSAFTMDKKKRTNSFRKIFSVFSSKDKKKKQDDKNKSQNTDHGAAYSNSYNNFNRESIYRHTTGVESRAQKPSNLTKVQRSDSDAKVPNQYSQEQLEKDYAQMHVSQFNRYKQNFEHLPTERNQLIQEGYTPMDKPIVKSNNTNNAYMNMPNVHKYIDTSSSASTLESDRSHLYQNEVFSKANESNQTRENMDTRNFAFNSFRVDNGKRDTPPRLLETKQDVRLVNPKALIPINSERSLPNPYQNTSPINSMSKEKPLSQSTPTSQESDSRPELNETYGVVLDSIERSSSLNRVLSAESIRGPQKSSRSPSLQPTKLKLPPNRDVVPLSPRVRSPIPPTDVSTEKIIATELLKSKRSPTPTQRGSKDLSPSHQTNEINRDYPDNVKYNSRDDLLNITGNLSSKPPVPVKPQVLSTEVNENYARAQGNRVTSPSNYYHRPPTNTDKSSSHINSPINRTPTPTNASMQNLSLSPIKTTLNRPSTPSGSRIPESPKTTPQKEDIRKSVEAFYWKEIKKLKDQENYDLYMFQMQYGNMIPYGYAEDPVGVRRSRSMSPSAARNGRRSLSLPRDSIRQTGNVIAANYYNNNSIPENQAVTNQIQPRSVQQLQFQQQQQQQQYFSRNTPERRTVDGSPRKNESNTNSLYRPIFKRGSLSTPPRQELGDDSLKRKVSFSGAQDRSLQPWPTKNGYTTSPPQRRIDKLQSQGDDEVFLPNSPQFVNDNQYQYNVRPDPYSEEIYYNNREPMYVATPNALYLRQRRIEENPYGQNVVPGQLQRNPEEVLYRQPIDAVTQRPIVYGLTRHGSIQINEDLYGQRMPSRRTSVQSTTSVRPSVPSTPVSIQEQQYGRRVSAVQPLRREIIVNDEIFGQFGGYTPSTSVRVVQNPNVYSSRQSIAEYNSRVREEYYNRNVQKQVTLTNKVCDFNGQIHDANPPKGQQSGVIVGQLQPGSPVVMRSSGNVHMVSRDGQFVRNSRLTASANDMYRRVQMVNPPPTNDPLYGKLEPIGAPTRPLPPVPYGKKGNVKSMVRNNIVSDTESGSDASEVQRILSGGSKIKKRGIFSK